MVGLLRPGRLEDLLMPKRLYTPSRRGGQGRTRLPAAAGLRGQLNG